MRDPVFLKDKKYLPLISEIKVTLDIPHLHCKIVQHHLFMIRQIIDGHLICQNLPMKNPAASCEECARYTIQHEITVWVILSQNPKHPGLQTHEFVSLKGPKGRKVFEAYAEQATPAAYRIFWYYGLIDSISGCSSLANEYVYCYNFF